MGLIPLRLKLWRSRDYYVLKVPRELSELFEKLRDSSGYVTVYVELPEGMQRAMAAQAEAERDRRAKIVHADGEYQASEKLAQAAGVLATQPAAIQLRYLQTLTQIATERTNTLVFPLPMDMVTAFLPNRRGETAERGEK